MVLSTRRMSFLSTCDKLFQRPLPHTSSRILSGFPKILGVNFQAASLGTPGKTPRLWRRGSHILTIGSSSPGPAPVPTGPFRRFLRGGRVFPPRGRRLCRAFFSGLPRLTSGPLLVLGPHLGAPPKASALALAAAGPTPAPARGGARRRASRPKPDCSPHLLGDAEILPLLFSHRARRVPALGRPTESHHARARSRASLSLAGAAEGGGAAAVAILLRGASILPPSCL